MNKKRILITGGAGFIGSLVNLMLIDQGHETIIYDNLSTGNKQALYGGTFIEGDLLDKEKLAKAFKEHRPDAVMHFAASTDVGESVENPALYYRNNFTASLNLLDAMVEQGVKPLIFSSTAAVYGMPDLPKIAEGHLCAPINPYGESKLMVEKTIRDYLTAFPLDAISLRYFNAAGADPSGRIRSFKKKENNLIPIIINAIKNDLPVTIYGTDYPTKDGTCIRDYIHVADIGEAHLLALEKLFAGNHAPCYNLGNGNGFTVREVIRAAEAVTGKKVAVIEGGRRAGDPPILLADAALANHELNWKPSFPNIEQMIKDAWNARK
jgi:UDP-glucose 4-epimerase